MLLYLMLMYKTLGGGSWTASLTHSPAECAESADFCSIDSQPLVSWKKIYTFLPAFIPYRSFVEPDPTL
jgi:hypothetical protein